MKSRAIQRRLDETVGPFNWRAEYRQWVTVGDLPSNLCILSIFTEEWKEWISKSDGAALTQEEPIKGGLSSAFKRAAVLWGIGRYLYDLEAQFVEVEEYKAGKYRMTKGGTEKLEKYYLSKIEKREGSDPFRFIAA